MRVSWRRTSWRCTVLLSIGACAFPESGSYRVIGQVVDPADAPVGRAEVEVVVLTYDCTSAMTSARTATADDGSYATPVLIGFSLACIDVRVTPPAGSGLAARTARSRDVETQARQSDVVRIDVRLDHAMAP